MPVPRTPERVVEVFKETPRGRLSERMGEKRSYSWCTSFFKIVEVWSTVEVDREEVDRYNLEVLVACDRPQRCQGPLAQQVVVSSFEDGVILPFVVLLSS